MTAIDVIAMVTPPRESPDSAGLSPLITYWLQQNAARWEEQYKKITEKEGLPLTCRQFQRGKVDIAQELPTDLVTYFVYKLDDRIAPEIYQILHEGRTHVVLILSENAVPIGHNFDILPLRAKRIEGTNLLFPMEKVPSYGHGPLIQVHELQNYTKKHMRQVLRQIIEQKERFEN